MKAVHNLTSDKFDLYVLGSPNPMSLRVSSSSGKIKGSAFGEGGQVLVCGGDDGFIHIFDGGGVELQTVTLSSDCSTVYALTVCGFSLVLYVFDIFPRHAQLRNII
jgi:WD40 repeat protein